MPKMRTISQAVQCLKAEDPECAVSEWWLRRLVKQNKIKYHKVGIKHLIDLDALKNFLANPPEEAISDDNQYGKLRRIT